MQISVRPGDTLWNYSIMFDIPFQLILDANPDSHGVLNVGDTIEIPGYEWHDYEIVAGDTLWLIAKRNNISVNLLLQSNPNLEVDQLHIGSKIRMPKRVVTRVVNGNRNYTYEHLEQDIANLQELYPMIKVHSIGQSVMGKNLYEIVIGNGPTEIHYNAAMHANEWITAGVLMTFINDYLLSITNSTPLNGQNVYPIYSTHTLSFVPMVNPDGVNLVLNGLPDEEPYRSSVYEINDENTDFQGWKANVNGVDLNKQFPALWEVDAVKGPQSPAPRDYSGSAPLTEPESIAVADLTRERNFNQVLAFHTQGEEIYWGFMGLEPPESEIIANRMAEASGYTPVQYVNSTAGYKDWFIQDWRRPGFTIELGMGQNPLPLTQFDDLTEATRAIILESFRNVNA